MLLILTGGAHLCEELTFRSVIKLACRFIRKHASRAREVCLCCPLLEEISLWLRGGKFFFFFGNISSQFSCWHIEILSDCLQSEGIRSRVQIWWHLEARIQTGGIGHLSSTSDPKYRKVMIYCWWEIITVVFWFLGYIWCYKMCICDVWPLKRTTNSLLTSFNRKNFGLSLYIKYVITKLIQTVEWSRSWHKSVK